MKLMLNLQITEFMHYLNIALLWIILVVSCIDAVLLFASFGAPSCKEHRR
jgi:hypothetical protein